MKIGDLIKVFECCIDSLTYCPCIFCETNSNRIGVVIKQDMPVYFERSGLSGMPQSKYDRHRVPVPYWTILFDFGEWDLHRGEVEILNENCLTIS